MLLAPIRTGCLLPDWWHHFGWSLAKGVSEEAGLQESAGVWCLVFTKFVHICWGKRPEAEAGGQICRSVRGPPCAVSSLRRECCTVLIPACVHLSKLE